MAGVFLFSVLELLQFGSLQSNFSCKISIQIPNKILIRASINRDIRKYPLKHPVFITIPNFRLECENIFNFVGHENIKTRRNNEVDKMKICLKARLFFPKGNSIILKLALFKEKFIERKMVDHMTPVL